MMNICCHTIYNNWSVLESFSPVLSIMRERMTGSVCK